MPSTAPSRRCDQARRAVAALAVVASVVVGAAPAHADHGPDSMYPTSETGSCVDGNLGDPFCRTDNTTLTVFRESSIGSTGRANIAWALNNRYDTTDLNVSYPSSASYTGDAETDIVYQQAGGVPSGLDGIAWCNDSVGGGECDQHYVRFRYADPSVRLSCHETGHAVGLTHPDMADPDQPADSPAFGCMVTPVFTDELRVHNRQQINAAY